MCGGAPTKML